eukprot:9491056-Pyramimonas_sp.AAC.1
MRQQRNLEGDVGGRAAHEPAEVVVLLGRQGVQGDVADQLRIGPAGRVEAEGHGDIGRALQ